MSPRIFTSRNGAAFDPALDTEDAHDTLALERESMLLRKSAEGPPMLVSRNASVNYVRDYLSPLTIDLETAINDAMTDSVGKWVRFQDDVEYELSAQVPGVSGVGLDFGTSRIVGTSRILGGLFDFTSQDNIRIRGGVHQLGKSFLPTYALADYDDRYNHAFVFTDCHNVLIEDLRTWDLYTNAILFYQCSGQLHVIGGEFRSPAQAQGYMAEHISFAGCAADCMVLGAHFLNDAPSSAALGVCQVFYSDIQGSMTIAHCVSQYGGRGSGYNHQLGAFSCYNSCRHVTLFDNKMYNTVAQAFRVTVGGRWHISKNYIDSAPTSISEAGNQLISIESQNTVVGSIQVGADNIEIEGNTAREDYDTTRPFCALGAYDWSTPLRMIDIHNNHLTNFKQVLLVGGPFVDISYHHNKHFGTNGSQILFLPAPGGLTVTSLFGVTESGGSFRNLTIERNTWDVAVSGAIPIFINIGSTSAATSGWAIDFNTLRPNNGSSSTQAIVIRGGGSSKGRVLIRGNDIGPYAVGIDCGGIKEVVTTGNQLQEITTATSRLLDSGSVGTWTQRDNKFGYGPTTGIVTLINGVGTVLTDEIRVGVNGTYNLLLWRRSPNASTQLGHIIEGTIASGSQFDVLSWAADASGIDAHDQSTVGWRIEH